ncbi:MAG: hypothetical protein DRP16_03050 [Candidatus Aenigmatarchaeota archaeon]|nr:MAG: hypothetical protein DRP16_03050 [Candidatus Aenigmarchaeota archaeon]
MVFFKKKKATESKTPRISLPPRRAKPIISSREYRLFKHQKKRKPNWYERLASSASKVLVMNPDENSRKQLEKAIAFAELQVTPADVMSLFILTILVSVVSGVLLGVLFSNLVLTLFIAAFGLGLGYYFYTYPSSLVKKLRIQASSEVVLAILYMVVAMRVSPNLENALRFTAANISGALAWDMRRLLWDIEMGRYYSASEALTDYIVKWKPENEEFAEALRLIRDSETQTVEKGKETLDEALNVILEGTKTRMKHYAQDLHLPVMVIHMMGIVLPILGTIMAPLAAVFMSDIVSPFHFVLAYDIVLPILIVWFINNTLSKRPVTFSQVDVSHHPELPPPGKFFLKKKPIPVWPVSLLVLIGFLILPVTYFLQNPQYLIPPIGADGKPELVNYPDSFTAIYTLSMSILIIFGIACALSVHFILSNYQRIRTQKGIQNIETQFELALFQLGNRIAGGTPPELAIEKCIDDVKDLEISGLFKIALKNIRNLGMTFYSAFFDKQYGALRYYPSKLIKNIMYAVIDTARKGVIYASEAMFRISRYLKNIRETQEYIRELLSETTSSMKFQAYFLTPLITGLIVSIADIIIQVLVQLGVYLEGMVGYGGELPGFLSVAEIFGGAPSTSPAMFQMIIGIYVIEVIIILAIFLTKISEGENKISQWYLAGKMLIVGIFIYMLIAIASSSMFGQLIREALSNIIG